MTTNQLQRNVCPLSVSKTIKARAFIRAIVTTALSRKAFSFLAAALPYCFALARQATPSLPPRYLKGLDGSESSIPSQIGGRYTLPFILDTSHAAGRQVNRLNFSEIAPTPPPFSFCGYVERAGGRVGERKRLEIRPTPLVK